MSKIKSIGRMLSRLEMTKISGAANYSSGIGDKCPVTCTNNGKGGCNSPECMCQQDRDTCINNGISNPIFITTKNGGILTNNTVVINESTQNSLSNIEYNILINDFR